jgi:hypothetical protein
MVVVATPAAGSPGGSGQRDGTVRRRSARNLAIAHSPGPPLTHLDLSRGSGGGTLSTR